MKHSIDTMSNGGSWASRESIVVLVARARTSGLARRAKRSQIQCNDSRRDNRCAK